MEKKHFKKKLTISTSSLTKKRTNKFEYAKGQNRSSVIVEKKHIGSGFKKPRQQFQKYKPKPFIKSGKVFYKNQDLFGKDFEKRKQAEQKATKRAKGQIDEERNARNKSSERKRNYKLTLSRALNEDDLEFKSRSLASIKRAKKKENKSTLNDTLPEAKKSIVRDIKIPNVITIRELANRMAEQASKIIKHLMGMGVTATINHSIDADTAEYLIKEFGHNPIREEKVDIKIDKS